MSRVMLIAGGSISVAALACVACLDRSAEHVSGTMGHVNPIGEVSILEASSVDVEAIATLADVRRHDYQRAQPQFWRAADGALAQHTPFLASLVADPAVISLVARRSDRLLGYLFASVMDAPPVYAPGGPTGFIDDFVVGSPSDWETVG
ncbi:MAG: hypothetical protein PSX37_13535, partial [bacterium]|nr:hypothetical protein [bacterium]